MSKKNVHSDVHSGRLEKIFKIDNWKYCDEVLENKSGPELLLKRQNSAGREKIFNSRKGWQYDVYGISFDRHSDE